MKYIAFLATGIILSIFFTYYHKRSYNHIGTGPYDFIIVGGGTAGNILANRLSKNASTMVLVIEAGDEPSGISGLLSKIPLAAPLLQLTSADWSYLIGPQKNCFKGMINKEFRAAAGKMLGGSSAINAMVYLRAHREDFNQWVDAGCKGWSYEDVEPYLRKLEDCQLEDDESCLKISKNDQLESLTQTFLKAGKDWGFNANYSFPPEVNNNVVIPAFSTIHKGERWSTYFSYLKSVLWRPNLHILPNSEVLKVNFINQRATSVTVKERKEAISLSSNGEVILSAGAIGSPRILLRSGIGPKNVLEKEKIKQLKELPVGKNLQDHPFMGAYFSIEKDLSITLMKMLSFWELKKYFTSRKGIFSVGYGVIGHGFFKSKFAENSTLSPDIQLQIVGAGSVVNPVMKWISHYTESIWEKFAPPNYHYGKEGFTLLVSLQKPKSRGDVTLNDINPNFYEKERDLDAHADGLEQMINFINESQAFKEIGVFPHLPDYKECNFQKPSRDYYKCILEHTSLAIMHMVGTCRMGHKDDQKSVVQPDLRLRGFSNIRVVDASIIPIIPSSNPLSTVAMVAEKASDMILLDYYSIIQPEKQFNKKN